MKLIKLSTYNPNAEFNANFDTDIIINTGTSIALKNLVFNVITTEFESSTASGEITYSIGSTGGLKVFVTPRRYTSIEFPLLLDNIQNALNRALTTSSSQAARPSHTAFDASDVFSQFRVSKNVNDRVQFEYRLSPLINPFDTNAVQGIDAHYMVTENRDILNNDFELAFIKNTNAPRTDEKYRFCSPLFVGLCKGNGVFYAQINNSVVGGLATASNGFGMGIAFVADGDATQINAPTPDIGGDDLSDKTRNIEILFSDGVTPYNYRTSNVNVASTETASTVTPLRFATATASTNDVLLIKVDINSDGKKIIEGSVLQFIPASPSSVKKVLFTHILTDADYASTFMPYIFFRGNGDTIKIQEPRMVLDPFDCSPADFASQHTSSVGDIGSPDTTFLPAFDDNPSLRISSVLNVNLPNPSPSRFDTTGPTTYILQSELANLLGFSLSNINLNMNQTVPFVSLSKVLTAPGVALKYAYKGTRFIFPNDPLYNNNDFFVLESQTLQLDSYNSSPNDTDFTDSKINNTQGSRKSILDTIPRTDIERIVIYEPDNLNFIDIKNSQKMNIRNLKFRILTKDFKPIQVLGETHLTLLIKD